MPRKSNTETQAPAGRPKRAAAPKRLTEEYSEDDKNPGHDIFQENFGLGKEDADGHDGDEMLEMLREFKKKAKPPSTSSARNKQLTAVANHYRKQAAALVEDMNAYIDKFIADNCHQQTDNADALWPATFKAAAQHTRATNEAIAAATRMTPHVLAERRAEDIERASTRLISLHPRRKKAHRRVLRSVRRDLGQILEEERVVADASAMVNTFKALTRNKKRRV